MTSRNASIVRAVLPVALCVAAVPALNAQASATGFRTLSFSAFAGTDLVSPDYGPQRDRGFVASGEVTRYLKYVSPGIEFRVGHATGVTFDERFLMGDVKFGRPVTRRLRAYVDGGFGYGVGSFGSQVKFSPGKSYSDNSIIFGVGGGLDVRLTRQFSARADFQHQFWDFGNEVNGMTPQVYTAGLVYRVPMAR